MELRSAKVDVLMTALSEVHKEFGVIIGKDSKGHKGTYASLPKVLESIHRMISNAGLVLTQYSCIIDGKPALKTILDHVLSCQWIAAVSYLTPADNAQSNDQSWGGSQTYHRRYDAMALLGLFSEDDESDNDGDSETKTQSSGGLSEKQVGLLKYKLQGNKEKEQAILTKLGITRLADMPWKKFQEVIDYLDK